MRRLRRPSPRRGCHRRGESCRTRGRPGHDRVCHSRRHPSHDGSRPDAYQYPHYHALFHEHTHAYQHPKPILDAHQYPDSHTHEHSNSIIDTNSHCHQYADANSHSDSHRHPDAVSNSGANSHHHAVSLSDTVPNPNDRSNTHANPRAGSDRSRRRNDRHSGISRWRRIAIPYACGRTGRQSHAHSNNSAIAGCARPIYRRHRRGKERGRSSRRRSVRIGIGVHHRHRRAYLDQSPRHRRLRPRNHHT